MCVYVLMCYHKYTLLVYAAQVLACHPQLPQLCVCVCVAQMHTSVSLLYTCETRLYAYVCLWAAALSGWP